MEIYKEEARYVTKELFCVFLNYISSLALHLAIIAFEFK